MALFLTGETAGWAILGLVAAFSRARGFSSVAAKDVLGKTIPRPRRGRLNGWSASAAGLVTIGVGAALAWPGTGRPDSGILGLWLLAAALLWLLAALVHSAVPEYPGETGGGRNILQAFGQLRLPVEDGPFRRFVLTRALLMCSALSAPFYIALAQGNMGAEIRVFGLFVAASGLASMVSAPIWGRFADASSRKVMITAALVTSGIGLLSFLVARHMPGWAASQWFLPLAFFALCVAHCGVRVGRKTYVVNLASGNLRTDYVAISNSAIGVLLLIVGAVGALASVIGNAGVIGLLALMGLAGAGLGSTLPEVED